MLIFILSVILSLSSLNAATETPDDFQESLYREHFLTSAPAKNAWEDFCEQQRGVVPVDSSQELIVSLTSYPARMRTTWLATESLLRQDTKPTRVVLNLFEGEFPSRKLPLTIERQTSRGLEINWYPENLRVFLKVLPAIKKYPNALVVAFDDDVIYPSNVLTDLMAGHRKYPDCVIARNVREVKVENRQVLPVTYWNFTGWRKANYGMEPALNLVPEGVFGILFPPSSLHLDFLRKDIFFQLCPSDDDVWLYTMTVMKGTKVVKIPTTQSLTYLLESQNNETALWRTNFKDNGRVLCETFKRLFEAYDLGRLLNADSVLTELSGEVALRLEIAKLASAVNGRVLTFLEKCFYA
jgi:hypothetical protein